MKKLIVILMIMLFPLMVSAEMGGNPRIGWDANTESDLAGYKIYYVESSKNWNSPDVRVMDVGNVTEYYIRNLLSLPENVEMLFAVTAYDTANNESSKGPDQPKETFDFEAPAPPIGCRILE